MKVFRDNAGREWSVQLDIGTVKRVRDLAGFDIGKAGIEKLAELVSDPVLLGDVLYVIVKPQCAERKISDVEFGRSLGGDSIDQAVEALMAEIIAFFPKRQRELLAQVWEKSERALAAGLQVALDQVNSPEFDRLMADTMARLAKSGNPSTGSPASSGSSPTG